MFCGSSIFRHRLSRLKKQPKDGATTVHRLYLFASLFGSFFLQVVVWNVAEASFLVDYDSVNLLSQTYWAWAIRPLPATFVLFMAYICPTLYLENALEMQFVEGMIGMLDIGIYNDIRKAMGSENEFANGDISVQDGLMDVMQGARLGFAFWILSLFVAVGVLAWVIFARIPYKNIPLRIWAGWSILFNMVRMIAGFLVFAGVAKMDETAFCPSLVATGAIIALAFGCTLVDHAWRAFFYVDGNRFRTFASIVP
jgi:hypothetical protein